MTQIIKDCFIHEFSNEHKPIAHVKLGETIEFETLDCYSGHLKSEKDLITHFPERLPNPATGPVYIENVDRGDLLEIKIKEIILNDYGIMPTLPNKGLLGEFVEMEETRILPIHNGMITLNEKVTFPVNKMIGVIGVAPKNEAVPNTTPGDHGGNMDTTDITEGNTLYLPVFHPGALLALGDLHAAMGDGELNGSGVEVSGKVKLKIDKIQDYTLNMPMVKTENEIIIISSAIDFHTAVKKAMKETIRLIQKKMELSFSDAYRLISAKGDLRISQIVNPELTVRIAIPKEWVNI